MRARHGFTLTELMVSVVMMAVVVMWLMQSFTTQQRSYVMLDEMTEAQGNMRAISDLLEREIRTAGMMVPENAAVCGIDNTNAPDVLYVSDADSLDPTGAKT
ncbi:MAG TPA: prepilin-type N-terminal cleavage/methylation domain-containing protein, partial [Dongiaceae bacterium]|nr:prepilin-type N-terminal cleavage/methylation domain-containing protein [Dongiaceae bacterium]